MQRHTLKNLHQKLAQKIWHKFITVSCTKTAAWPIALNGSCHMLGSFCDGIETAVLNCVQETCTRKKLVLDWPTHVQVSCTRRLAQVSGASLLIVCRRRYVGYILSWVTMWCDFSINWRRKWRSRRRSGSRLLIRWWSCGIRAWLRSSTKTTEWVAMTTVWFLF